MITIMYTYQYQRRFCLCIYLFPDSSEKYCVSPETSCFHVQSSNTDWAICTNMTLNNKIPKQFNKPKYRF